MNYTALSVRGIIGTMVLLEILSIAIVGSYWPWGIVSHESIGLRILGWYLIGQTSVAALGFMFVKFAIPDADCPICNRDLKTFISVYGQPEACHRCRTWFHKRCRNSRNKPCPVCYPESGSDHEIPLDFSSRFRLTRDE